MHFYRKKYSRFLNVRIKIPPTSMHKVIFYKKQYIVCVAQMEKIGFSGIPYVRTRKRCRKKKTKNRWMLNETVFYYRRSDDTG